MSLEQKINYQLNKFPAVKKGIKRLYQIGMYTISPKIKSQGNITRVSPDDNHEYFLAIMINLHGTLQIDICFV